MTIVARIILGVLFVLSSVAKLSSMESFELYIFSFSFAGFDLCSLVARAVVIGEFVLGAFLLLRLFVKPVNVLTAVSLAGFSAFLLWRFFLGDQESCHCMGELVDMDPGQSLLKNLFLALLLGLGWKAPQMKFRYSSILSGALVAAVSVAVFAVSPPDLYFRNSSQSDDLSTEAFRPVADSLGLSHGRRVVCFYSASCEHCRHCASKMAGIIRRHDLPLESVSVIFMQTHPDQDSVVTDFYSSHGEGLVLSYDVLHPFDFLPLTDGAMPVVGLFDDGVLVKEYDYITVDEKELVKFVGSKE